jgi:hypothetical protein
VANGLISHNSFHHARIMRELDLPDNEMLEFAELHAGVVSPQKGQLNPYYLGYKLFEDIERRWESPTDEEREKFGRKFVQDEVGSCFGRRRRLGCTFRRPEHSQNSRAIPKCLLGRIFSSQGSKARPI